MLRCGQGLLYVCGRLDAVTTSSAPAGGRDGVAGGMTHSQVRSQLAFENVLA